MESESNYEPDSNYEPESEEPEDEDEDQSIDNGKRYECNFEGCKAIFIRPSRLKHHMNVHKNKVTSIETYC